MHAVTVTDQAKPAEAPSQTPRPAEQACPTCGGRLRVRNTVRPWRRPGVTVRYWYCDHCQETKAKTEAQRVPLRCKRVRGTDGRYSRNVDPDYVAFLRAELARLTALA